MSRIFQGVLVFSLLVAAFLSWLSVDRAIRLPGSDVWLLWIVPMICFSVFVILLCLSLALLREKNVIIGVLLVAFSLGLFFVLNPLHLLILLVSFLLAVLGVGIVRKDLVLRVKISPWKSFTFGKAYIILALTILISSQYYFTMSSIDGQKNMPKLDFGKYIAKYTIPVLGVVNPTFKDVDKEGLTVDEYLLTAQKDNNMDGVFGSVSTDFIDAQIPSNIPPQQREILKQEAMRKIMETQNQVSQKNKDSILVEMRRQFSKSIGQDLTGNEKMSEVFAGMISQKMNGILQTPLKNGGTVASMLPLIFSLVLFTISLTVSWFLGMIWPLFVFIIFEMLVKTGLVKIGKEMVEKETVVY